MNPGSVRASPRARDATLVVVDIRNDFFSGGALAVSDAEAVLQVVNGLMWNFQRVILTRDWHPPSHVSFASSHPGHAVFGRITLPYGERVLWPDHCVEGTQGRAGDGDEGSGQERSTHARRLVTPPPDGSCA